MTNAERQVEALLAEVERMRRVVKAARLVSGNRRWTTGLDELRAALGAYDGLRAEVG